MAFGGFGGGVGFGAGLGGFGAAPAAPAAAAGEALDRDVQVQLPPGTDTISAVNFSPVGSFLAYSSWDGKVGVYEVGRGADGSITGANPKLLSNDLGAPVLDFKWSPDGSSICAVGCNKKVQLWNLAANAWTDLGTHDAPVKAVNWCPTLNCFVTGGWDNTLRYWDPRSPRQIERVDLPAKLNCMDVKDDVMVIATADKKFYVFNLNNPKQPARPAVDSPLKMGTRCLRICHDKNFYLAASAEGRCAIRCVDGAMDAAKIPNTNPEKMYAFAFKCHRSNDLIFPVNAVDAHPMREFQSAFATAAGDGTVCFWDRDKRQRIREMKVSSAVPGNLQIPVTDCRWNPTGDMFAWALGYDWSKGGEYYDQAKYPVSLWLHQVVPDKDLRKKG